MRTKDLLNIALMAGIGYVLYRHFGTGASWGQSLPFGLGPTLGIQGLGCGNCPDLNVCADSCKCSRGLGYIVPTPYLSGGRRVTAGVPMLAERLLVQ